MPTTMLQPPAPDHDAVVVEADTTSEAVAAVADQLGEDATVVSAERVLRGGIRGFFGAQRVRLTAVPASEPSEPSQPSPPDQCIAGQRNTDREAADQDAATGLDEGIDAALRRLAADEGDREADFAAALRRQLHLDDEPRDEVPTPAANSEPPEPLEPSEPAEPAAPEPIPHVEANGPRWSTGVPLLLPHAVAAQAAASRPSSDAEWLLALADAVTPLCGHLPVGPELLVGPHASAVAMSLGVPVWEDLTADPPAGDRLAADTRDTAAAVEQIEAVRDDRAVHVVLSGRGLLRHLHGLAPTIVSWVGDDALCEALEIASGGGAVLGYGRDGRGRSQPVYRATAMDVAVALRRMMPR